MFRNVSSVWHYYVIAWSVLVYACSHFFSYLNIIHYGRQTICLFYEGNPPATRRVCGLQPDVCRVPGRVWVAIHRNVAR